MNEKVYNKTLATATIWMGNTLRNLQSLLLVRKYRSLDIWNSDYVSWPDRLCDTEVYSVGLKMMDKNLMTNNSI